jgi:hypothetical protein
VRFDIQAICDLHDQRAGHAWGDEDQHRIGTVKIPSGGIRTTGHDQGNLRASEKDTRGSDERTSVDNRRSL